MAKTDTYDEDMKKLQATVERLSEGNIPMAEMIKLFEEGRALAKKCRKTLDSYEARLTILEEGNGEA